MSTDLSRQVTLDVVRSPSQARPAAPAIKVVGGGQDTRQIDPLSGKSVPEVTATEGANQEELTKAVSQLNNHVQNIKRDLEFTIDEDLNRTIITVLDSETKEVIRQIPSEEVLALARSLASNEGVLLKVKA